MCEEMLILWATLLMLKRDTSLQVTGEEGSRHANEGDIQVSHINSLNLLENNGKRGKGLLFFGEEWVSK